MERTQEKLLKEEDKIVSLDPALINLNKAIKEFTVVPVSSKTVTKNYGFIAGDFVYNPLTNSVFRVIESGGHDFRAYGIVRNRIVYTNRQYSIIQKLKPFERLQDFRNKNDAQKYTVAFYDVSGNKVTCNHYTEERAEQHAKALVSYYGLTINNVKVLKVVRCLGGSRHAITSR